MKNRTAGILLASLFMISPEAAPSRKAAQVPATVISPSALSPSPDFGLVPLYFIPNQGQAAAEAAFYARASRYMLWFTKTGLVFDSARRAGKPEAGHKIDGGKRPNLQAAWDRDVSELVFPGANESPRMEALDGSEHRVNLFLGNDPSGWRTGLATSRAVLYKDLFKNVDLKVYGVEKEIEYDWIIKPGGRVADIHFEYRGVLGTDIDPDGGLRVRTRFGDLVHCKPQAYQTIGGERKTVESRFDSRGDNRYGFIVGPYDHSRELIIDPVVLISSTYLGGNRADAATSLALDKAGNIYLTGETFQRGLDWDSWSRLSTLIMASSR